MFDFFTWEFRHFPATKSWTSSRKNLTLAQNGITCVSQYVSFGNHFRKKNIYPLNFLINTKHCVSHNFLLIRTIRYKFFLMFFFHRVMYFSMHRYDFGKFWPNLRQSDFDYIGEGAGKGYNLNVPLNKVKTLISKKFKIFWLNTIYLFKKTGFGNAEYLSAFYNLLLPIAYEVNWYLISALNQTLICMFPNFSF